MMNTDTGDAPATQKSMASYDYATLAVNLANRFGLEPPVTRSTVMHTVHAAYLQGGERAVLEAIDKLEAIARQYVESTEFL